MSELEDLKAVIAETLADMDHAIDGYEAAGREAIAAGREACQ